MWKQDGLYATCMPVQQVGSYLVGGGPQQGVLLLRRKAAQHVADVVGAEHGGDPQAGGQQARQGALARATSARQEHCHTAALLLDAADSAQRRCDMMCGVHRRGEACCRKCIEEV